MTKKKPLPEFDYKIKALSSAQVQRMRFAPLQPDYFCMILGCLQEYFGGYQRSKHHGVDFFFLDETRHAKKFVQLCRQHLASRGLEDDVVVKKQESGHISVYSATIARQLRRFFNKKNPDSFLYATWLSTKYDDWNNAQIISYIAGVYMRNYQPRGFIFANPGDKVQLFHSFLRRHSTSGNVITMESHFNIPCVTIINMDKKHELWKPIRRFVRSVKKK